MATLALVGFIISLVIGIGIMAEGVVFWIGGHVKRGILFFVIGFVFIIFAAFLVGTVIQIPDAIILPIDN